MRELPAKASNRERTVEGLSVCGVLEHPALFDQKAMQGHLMPHAAKGKGGEHFATSRIDCHWSAKSIGYGSNEFWDTGPNERHNSAQSLGLKKEKENYGGNYSTVKSAQRLSATLSIRPRGRVQIIDM